MSHITNHFLGVAIQRANAMTLAEKEVEFDVIYREQPNLLGSVLVLQQMGNSLEQLDVLLNLLLIIHLALKEADITIKMVTEQMQEQELKRQVGRTLFVDDLDEPERSQALEQQLADLPEQWLYAYAFKEMRDAGFMELDYEASKYLILCGLNLVACASAAIRQD